MDIVSERVVRAIDRACEGLVDRRALVELVVLGAVTREHLLVVGPPGTGKSQAVRRIAAELGGQYFEYLIGSFTEPNEIFGPIDLRRLREGVVSTETAGMLPEADVAFLDEVFLGSTAILNTLLGLLNERVFRRGKTATTCPLRICVGASNRLPDDEQLLAFADRFLLRAFVEPMPDASLEALLREGWSKPSAASTPHASLDDLDALGLRAEQIDLDAVRPLLAQAVRRLRSAGIALSDRRIVRLQRLIAGAAAIAGRDAASAADLWPIVFALPTAELQAQGREVLVDLLASAENAVLLAASEDGSLGPAARGALLLREGQALLADDGARDEGWRLKLEGVARDIDATFSSDRLPEDLRALRARIVEAVTPPGS